MYNHTIAQAEAEAMLRTQAIRTAVTLIKNRARTFAKSPMLLETVRPGLASTMPETVIAVARDLVMTHRDSPCRWFGAGGEIPAVSVKAVLLFGRTLCRRSGLRTGLGACNPTLPG
jgi:hypothetical protein